jgi:outer membrane protein assembly factor BamB
MAVRAVASAGFLILGYGMLACGGGGGSAPAPVADFSLAAAPTSLSITAGGTAQTVSLTATAINGFTGSVTVAISGLPTGVTASLTLTADGMAAAGTPTVTFTGTSGALSHAAKLALTVQTGATTNAPDVTTYHDDNARDGLNSAETILTTANVNSTSFGKIAFDSVDGLVDAEPLYLANITVGGTLRNVLYVATEHGSVYAFDADSGKQLWMTSLLGSGETTVAAPSGCGQISPEIGITSTPVIDRKQGANGTIFTVAMSQDSSGADHQRLHALDLTTGAEITGSPTEISATYPGSGDNSQNGNVVFAPAQYAERAALLLSGGNIYTAWTSHCDARPYTGWVMSYSESTLKQNQVLDLTRTEAMARSGCRAMARLPIAAATSTCWMRTAPSTWASIATAFRPWATTETA